MTIQYCSDLHLEFPQNRLYLESNPLVPKGEVLLLAGDIVPFQLIDKYKDFFDFLSANFKVTYWLPGNHEYYHFDLVKRCGSFREQIRSNILLVNNLSVSHGDVRLIFSTLWARIDPAYEWIMQQSITDFHRIRYKGKPFTPADFNVQHQESLAFLKKGLQTNVGTTVVVTHHVPTFLNYPEKFRGDIFNQAFGVELFDFIAASKADYWIYGHHHSNVPQFSIGDTRLLTNQLGYIKYGENQFFDPGKII